MYMGSHIYITAIASKLECPEACLGFAPALILWRFLAATTTTMTCSSMQQKRNKKNNDKFRAANQEMIMLEAIVKFDGTFVSPSVGELFSPARSRLAALS